MCCASFSVPSTPITKKRVGEWSVKEKKEKNDFQKGVVEKMGKRNGFCKKNLERMIFYSLSPTHTHTHTQICFGNY